MDGVANTLLDVARSNESPQALNLVHPRPVPFESIISSVGNALVEEGVTQSALSIIPFNEWFARLDAAAAGASDEDIKVIVSLFAFPSDISCS